MSEKIKKIDKFTIILMTVLFIVAIIYMTTWSLALMSITSAILGLVLLIALIIIPLFCCLIFVLIMYIIRYIQNKENRLKRVLKTIAIIVITLVVIFSAHHILLEYCLFGSYEVQVEKKLNEIEDIDLRSILESSLERYENYEQFEIQKVIIEPGFPDDYHMYVHYRDITYKVEKRFISDSYFSLIDENAKNITDILGVISIIITLVGYILYIYFVRYILKEFKRISNN